MSLTHRTFQQVVLKQAKWKIKAYSQTLVPLFILQIFMGFISYGNGNGMSILGNGTFSVEIHIYSLDAFIIATCLWSFITAFLIQTKGYLQFDFSLVTNRATGNISNTIVLISYSLIATVIVFMSLYILVALNLVFSGNSIVPDVNLFSIMSFVAAFLLILLSASGGYFLSSLFNLSKVLGSVVILLLGYFIFGILEEKLLTLMKFYIGGEFSLFFVKAILTTGLLFTLPIVFLNKKEVIRG